MIVRGRDFADIYDLVGIRVLVDDVRDCYAALGTVHALWSPVPGRFKDYIAMPKFNMYQSLHTTVIGPQGKPVELQIRTEEMHRRAEYGIAAHWKYKEGAGVPTPVKGDDMAWLRQLLDWQKEAADPGEFMDSLRFDLHSNEVFVFTPKGDVLSLPTGSTPVDFAYAVHTEVGHRCIGARVNGRLVPLESPLENGDVVEIFTSKAETAHPSQDWLQFVQSPRARNKIQQWFAKERREDAVEAGKEALTRAVRKQGLPLQRLLGGDALPLLARDLRLTDVTALYVEIGEGRLSAQAAVQQDHGRAWAAPRAPSRTSPRPRPRPSRRAARHRLRQRPGHRRQGRVRHLGQARQVLHPGARATTIVGFVTRGRGVSVHRARLRQRRTAARRRRSASSTSSGRRPPARCSSSTSRSRRSTAPACSPTSRGCCPTPTSTSCRRRSRPPATASRSPASRSRWATPSTSGTCSTWCATCRASTTPTASRPRRRGSDERPVVAGRGPAAHRRAALLARAPS